MTLWRPLEAGELPLAGPFRVVTSRSSSRVDDWADAIAIAERELDGSATIYVPRLAVFGAL